MHIKRNTYILLSINRIMDNTAKNLVIASIVLTLLVMFGGNALGSWFVVETDSPYAADEYKANFYLTEYKAESNEEDVDVEYGDDYQGIEVLTDMEELMIEKIQNLLYINILAGIVALYFLSEDDDEKASLSALVMGVASLAAIFLFATSFAEALDDDIAYFERMDEDPSLFGSYDYEDGDTEEKWRPDIAVLLVFVSGLFGMAAYFEIKS